MAEKDSGTLVTGKILASIQHIRPGPSQDGDDGEQEYHTFTALEQTELYTCSYELRAQ